MKSEQAKASKDRKQAEDELRESETKFRTIFESFEDLYYQTDLNGIITLVSPSVYRLSGWKPEDLIGQPATLVYDTPGDRAALLKAMAEQGYVRDYELTLIKRDGSRAMASLSAHLLYDSAGTLIGLAGSLRDITERKKAEIKLRESEERYRTLFNNANDAVFILKDYKFIDCNDETLKVFGCSREQIIGCYPDEFSPPFQPDGSASEEKALKNMNAALLGKPQFFEWRHCRYDRTPFDAEVSLNSIKVGDAFLIQAFVRDITEHKRTEEAIRENERRLSTLMSNLPGMAYRCLNDKDWTMEFVSEGCLALTGYKPADLVKNQRISFADLIHPQDREHVWDVVQSGVQNKNKYQITYRITTTDGKIKWVWEQGQGVFSESGDLLALEGLITDITERKRIEEELQKEKEFSQTLVHNSPTFFVAISSTGKIIMMNDTLLQALGYTKNEVVGRDYLTTFVPESNRESLSKVFAQLTHLKKNTINENYILAKDGRRLLVEWHGTTVFKKGNEFDYFFGVGIDITERRRLEEEREKLQEQLTQAQKMESVGRLAGGVAHDFNNMLGVILGRAEIAMMKADPAQPSYKDLQEIRKAAERSADLTRQLLAFARKQTIAPQVLDLNEVVEGMLKMLRRLIGEDIDLVWLPDAALWPVKMDTTQIDQILANLCVNARDAISGVGKVIIETGATIFDKAHCANHPGFIPGEYVLLAVSDNGSGMDKDTLDKLFEPFFTTKAMGKGTGLGLATVYGIVKQNNGFINVYSEPGQGTTFRIYLPRHVGKAGLLLADEITDTAAPGNETILLTEDEPAILEMTTLMLQHLGYTVLPAGTPGEAIRLAGEHRGKIHLLMTDVVMPEMNGRDLARNILSLYPDIKRLFMSGYTANTIAHHGVLDDGVHFIQKPFSLNDLAAKLRETLDRE